jgi:hypothetical protein
LRRLKSSLSPEEFYDNLKVKEICYKEVKDLLMEMLCAKKVEVLEHEVIT